MVVLQSIGCAMASWQRPAQSSLKSRGSITSPPSRSVCETSDLYIDDMHACVSVKKVSGAVSSLARRNPFVGHWRNATNTAAVIELLSIVPWIMPELRRARCARNRLQQRVGRGHQAAARAAKQGPQMSDMGQENALIKQKISP